MEQNLNLENLLKAARAMLPANKQTSEIGKQQSHAVGHVQNKTSDDRQSTTSDNGQSRSGSGNTSCGLCSANCLYQG